MGDAAKDLGNEGVNAVDANNLSSIGKEAFYPGIDFSTDAIGPDLL